MNEIQPVPALEDAKTMANVLTELKNLEEALMREAARVSRTRADFERDPTGEGAAAFVGVFARDEADRLRSLAALPDGIARAAAERTP